MDARFLAAGAREPATHGPRGRDGGSGAAEALAAAADALLLDPAGRAEVAARIAATLPDGPIDAGWAGRIAPLLVGAAVPRIWNLLREEFRASIADRMEEASPIAAIHAPSRRPAALPILIAARDEAAVLYRTLSGMVPAIRFLHERRPETEVSVHLCDNASRDTTARVMEAIRGELGRNGIPAHVHREPVPGKERALKRMLSAVAPASPERVVFADADADWEPTTLAALGDYLDLHPGIDFAGARIVPRPGSMRRGCVWGVLDTVPFLGFGGPEPHGRGRHFRFVSGMTYMGRMPAARRIHERIPLSILNEDVALSFLAGTQRIAIARAAVVAYRAAQSRREFLSLRSRHVRGCMQILDWATALAAARSVASELEAKGRGAVPAGRWPRHVRGILAKARRRERAAVRGVVEIGTLPMARSLVLERHEIPIPGKDGRISMEPRVALLASPAHFLAISTLMLPFYTGMKIAARARLSRTGTDEGWTPFRGAAPHDRLAADPGPRDGLD